jgi:hypothetical protein
MSIFESPMRGECVSRLEAAPQSIVEGISVKYIVLIYADPKAQGQSEVSDWMTYTDALRQAGVYVAGEALQPGDAATTLRHNNGKRVVTDGPFAETKELLSGFYIIETPDIDVALDWASRMPDSKINTLELRPVMVF